MDPVTAVLIGMLILIVIGGVWGTMIISALLKKRSPQQLGALADNERLAGVEEDYRQLEARFGQLEEEVGFLRQLRESGSPGRLPSAEAGDSSQEVRS